MSEPNKVETATEVVNEEEVEDLEWSADQEVLLLYSLNGYKPVGRDKHFHMMIIQERLSNAMNKNVSSKAIWKKLNSWYDLEALDEAEAETDAVEAVDVDFTLPEDEFGSLMHDKIKGPVIKVEKIQIQQQTISTLAWNKRQVEPEPPSELATVVVKQEPEEEEETNVRRMNRSKTATPVKDQAAAVKKEKETPKKEAAGKKEAAKEPRKGKEEDKKESKKPPQETKKDAAKEDKKDPGAKANKRESTDKKAEKKEEKESKKEVKKSEVVKTPKRAETPKQTKEVPKHTKTKGETPKLQKSEGKKDVTEKKTLEKKAVEVKIEKTTDSPRGERLRTRGGEKKEEPEKPETPINTGTKRERPRDSTGSADEPAAKKMKGRTRNSIESNPPPPSPPRRRTRVS